MGGQDVTLECHSEAFPKSINFWVNNKGAMLVSNSKYEAVSVDSGYKVYMKLHIRNITKEDFMEYRCVARNSLGDSDGSITLYEVSRPTPSTTTVVTTVGPETTTLQRRQRMRARHRKRLRESRRHSYTVEGEAAQDIDEERRVSILHREREEEEQRQNHILDQGDRESLEVGSMEDREEAKKKKGQEFGQERGFFGSSHATPSTELSLNLFLILVLLGLWTV